MPASSPEPLKLKTDIIRCLWFNGHFKRSVESFAEDPVSFLDVVERECMCQQRSQIHSPAPDHFHQTSHPLLAPRAERRHDSVIAQPRGKSVVWNIEFARINSEAR